MTTILETGKHSGKTLKQVYIEDFNYFIWLTSTDIVDHDLFSEFNFDCHDFLMTFGKYKGFKLSSIAHKDKGYFKFLLQKKDEFTSPKLKSAIEFYSKF